MSDIVQADPADTNNAPELTESDENSASDTVTPDGEENASETQIEGITDDSADGDESADSFPREYVEKLRRESANYREKAKTAEQQAQEANVMLDAMMRRLHATLVAETGKLADPDDLPFDVGHLYDSETLNTAIDALLADKPHLRSRKPVGDVGQGNRGGAGEFSLMDLLKSRA